MELHPDNRDAATLSSFVMRRLFVADPVSGEIYSSVVSGMVAGMTQAKGADKAGSTAATALDALNAEGVRRSLQRVHERSKQLDGD